MTRKENDESRQTASTLPNTADRKRGSVGQSPEYPRLGSRTYLAKIPYSSGTISKPSSRPKGSQSRKISPNRSKELRHVHSIDKIKSKTFLRPSTSHKKLSRNVSRDSLRAAGSKSRKGLKKSQSKRTLNAKAKKSLKKVSKQRTHQRNVTSFTGAKSQKLRTHQKRGSVIPMTTLKLANALKPEPSRLIKTQSSLAKRKVQITSRTISRTDKAKRMSHDITTPQLRAYCLDLSTKVRELKKRAGSKNGRRSGRCSVQFG